MLFTLIICVFVLAIKFDKGNRDIPNYLFKCSHYECKKGYYTKGKDWDFYPNNGKKYSGCRDCIKTCEDDLKCKSLECGEDQPLLNGTTRYAQCLCKCTRACGHTSKTPHRAIALKASYSGKNCSGVKEMTTSCRKRPCTGMPVLSNSLLLEGL